MYHNSDIEKLMTESTCYSKNEKYKEVALKLVGESEKHKVARNIQKQWDLRRDLVRKGDTENLESWRAEVFPIPTTSQSSNESGDVPSVVGPGRPKKRLSDNPVRKTENSILDRLLESIEQFAEQECVPPQTLLQKLVQRSKEKWDKEPTEPSGKCHVPVTDACAMMFNINLSVQQYQKLRTYLMEHSIYLPPRNEVDSYKKTLQCEFKVEATKTSCSFPVLFNDTVGALLSQQSTSFLGEGDVVKVEGKIGIDGSGSHQIRHQLAEDSDDEGEDDKGKDEKKSETSYIGIFWCPLSIHVNDALFWSNILPNSTMYSRPICLMREKENRESVQEHFKPYIDEMHAMETEESYINIGGKSQLLSVHTELSMVDGKMVDLIQGDAGSFCHYCYVTRAQANDLTCILQGFVIEKSVQEMLEKWDQIESGEMSYEDPKRGGQCHKPMNNADLRFFAIMHQKLRSLDNCLKMLYHLVSGQTHTWSESNPNVKDAIKKAKKECIDHIRKECRFLVDCPTQIGGNTNTGPLADNFFSSEHRLKICNVIRKSSDRVAFAELLSYFNKMLSITQQCDITRIVKIDMVKQLGQQLMVFYKQNFPFAMISPSVHQMCAHSWELFSMTDGKPIAVYAEQSVEAWNKHIRAFKSGPSSRARQCSIKLNTRDIFTRMLVQSHPIIASKRRVLKCKRCEKHGHTIRSCPMNVATVQDAEKTFIDSCYM